MKRPRPIKKISPSYSTTSKYYGKFKSNIEWYKHFGKSIGYDEKTYSNIKPSSYFNKIKNQQYKYFSKHAREQALTDVEKLVGPAQRYIRSRNLFKEYLETEELPSIEASMLNKFYELLGENFYTSHGKQFSRAINAIAKEKGYQAIEEAIEELFNKYEITPDSDIKYINYMTINNYLDDIIEYVKENYDDFSDELNSKISKIQDEMEASVSMELM